MKEKILIQIAQALTLLPVLNEPNKTGRENRRERRKLERKKLK